MVSTSWKGVAFGVRLFLQVRLHPIRRNVSSIWTGCRFFSSGLDNCIQMEVDGRKEEIARNLLRSHGFNDAQISELARLNSQVYVLSATKIIQPKLEFLNSIGILNADLPKILLRARFILSTSLEMQMIPCYNYLKTIFSTNERVIHLLRYRPGILITGVNSVLAPNLELLRGLGVPVSSITAFITRCDSTLCRNHQAFKGFVEQAIKMGLNPASRRFILAVHVLCSISKDKWDHKWKLFRSIGLSEDDVLVAFRRRPMIMALSQKKIVETLDFCVKTMRWNPSIFVHFPLILLYSFEGRIAPRCRVMEILTNKGLIKIPSPSTYLKMSEEKFLNRYYLKFKDDLPELMDVYIISKSSQCKIKDHVHVD